MPSIKNNIFNRKNLNYLLVKFNQSSIPDFQEKLEKIKDWINYIQSGNIYSAKETALQGKFLDDIFSCVLGYKSRIKHTELWNLNQEQLTSIDSKFADGSLGFFTNEIEDVRVVIELKDANTNLDEKQHRHNDTRTPIEQAFSYQHKIGSKCKWIIVSNFKEIRLYHNSSSTEYEVFNITELDNWEHFRRFYYLLTFDNLIATSGESLIDSLYTRNEAEEVNISKEFYAAFKQVRIKLYEHLKINNPDVSELLILEKTQKFLDRFIFICFCEDNRLLPEKTFKTLIGVSKKTFSYSDTKIWTELKGLFHAINIGSPPHNINKFNGGLFADDKDLDSLVIKDDILETIAELTEYDFETDVDVNILGHIFEQSISDIEEIKAGIEGKDFDKKTSKRKKDGIYYTPEYITKYIVENAIGGWLEDRKKELGFYELPELNPEEMQSIKIVKGKPQLNDKLQKHLAYWLAYKERLMNIKVLDPACGSGAFLNQAFNFLYAEGQSINDKIADLSGGQGELFELDKHILSQNLFGVDLNNESVDITKLSLWLKTANRNSELTSLDKNIKCGNSLIDDPEVAGDKAFDWMKEFPDIFITKNIPLYEESVGLNRTSVSFNEPSVGLNEASVSFNEPSVQSNEPSVQSNKPSVSFNERSVQFNEHSVSFKGESVERGFDVIIGNPPYGADLTNKDRIYLDNKYNIGSTDTAILFIKKAKYLLNDNGYLGFIIPKAFSFASNYQKVRELVWFNLKSLIDCRKVWKEVLLEQVITIINNNSQSQYDIGILVNHKIGIIGRIEKETAKKFGFFINGISEIETNIGMKILNNSITLNKIAVNRRGAMLQKSIIQGYPIKDDEIIIIGGAEINKFGLTGFKGKVNRNNHKIDQALLIDNSILVQNIIAHIENPTDHIKITACIPETNDFVITDTINQITINSEYVPHYIWSLLNSKLMNWYAYRFIFGKAIRTMHFDNSVTSRIPIKEVTNPQQQFIDSANTMLEKNKELQVIRNKFLNFLKSKFNLEKPSTKLNNWFELEFKDFISELKKAKVVLSLHDEMSWQPLFEQNKSEALTTQTIIAETDKKIDSMVYKLYGLTEEEIKIVEGD